MADVQEVFQAECQGALEVFLRGMTTAVNKEDVNKMVYVQQHM